MIGTTFIRSLAARERQQIVFDRYLYRNACDESSFVRRSQGFRATASRRCAGCSRTWTRTATGSCRPPTCTRCATTSASAACGRSWRRAAAAGAWREAAGAPACGARRGRARRWPARTRARRPAPTCPPATRAASTARASATPRSACAGAWTRTASSCPARAPRARPPAPVSARLALAAIRVRCICYSARGPPFLHV